MSYKKLIILLLFIGCGSNPFPSMCGDKGEFITEQILNAAKKDLNEATE